jgi:hypothetical protein
MSIIDADGFFSGDRLRRCSNAAQLHWPRLFLASDGFGRLELNYHKIVARAYATFDPVPSEHELRGFLTEYAKNYLLFIYGSDGQVWGQWDTPAEFLPRYKTSIDKRSPIPPETAFSEWKKRYRAETKSLPKCFGNIPEGFLCGKGLVGYGVGKELVENTCASDDARVRDQPSIDPPFTTTEPDGMFSEQDLPVNPQAERRRVQRQQDLWFEQWWAVYWLKKSRKRAREAFGKHVRTEALFQQVMAATKAQSPEMLSREPKHRPHGATWLNGARWEDEAAPEATPKHDTAADTLTKMIYGETK